MGSVSCCLGTERAKDISSQDGHDHVRDSVAIGTDGALLGVADVNSHSSAGPPGVWKAKDSSDPVNASVPDAGADMPDGCNPESSAKVADAGLKPKTDGKFSRRKRMAENQNQFADLSRYLRNPELKVVSGALISLQKETCMSELDLANVFDATMANGAFRWFANRSILDFKVKGANRLSLDPPYDMLNPLVAIMIALAMRSLADGEELAILQLIVNLFKDCDSQVKSHRHRCRQICVSLGAPRDLEVKGHGTIAMQSGDALPLMGETHSVPPARLQGQPRISVCLFYSSAVEYAAETVSVNSTGDSYWWQHPRDAARDAARDGGRSYVAQRGSWGSQRRDWARGGWGSGW